MPRCRLTKHLVLNGQPVEGFSCAVLLLYGERWEVVDPANNNVLIAGMTTSFKDMLIAKGLLTIDGLLPNEASHSGS